MPTGNCKKMFELERRTAWCKKNLLPLRLETYLAWTFLFLCSFLNNYPWTLEKFVFQQALSIKSGAKTKNQGVAGWKVGQTWHRDNCSHAKCNKNTETLLAQQNFSLLIWDRQLKFMLQHPTVWFDRKQLKYLSKEMLCMIFCTRGRLMSERLWQTALADLTVSKNPWKIFAGHIGDWFDV